MPRARRRSTPISFPRAGAGHVHPLVYHTALTQVNPSEEQEARFAGYDLLVCHPNVNTALLQAAHPTPKKIIYSVASLILNFGASGWWFDLEADIVSAFGEDAFWHDGAPAEGTRISLDTDQYIARPSAALGAFIADWVVDHMDPYFEGTMVDECQATIPNNGPEDYWALIKTNTDIALTDANKPHWDAQWVAMQNAMLHGLKAIWQDERIVIANSAGATYPLIDGITIEASHVNTNGVPWAIERFRQQENFWRQSPWRYRSEGPLNVVWSSASSGNPLQAPKFIMAGTNEG